MAVGKWRISCNNAGGSPLYQVWRQTRELRPGEPMHSGVRECAEVFETREEAEKCAEKLDSGEEE